MGRLHLLRLMMREAKAAIGCLKLDPQLCHPLLLIQAIRHHCLHWLMTVWIVLRSPRQFGNLHLSFLNLVICVVYSSCLSAMVSLITYGLSNVLSSMHCLSSEECKGADEPELYKTDEGAENGTPHSKMQLLRCRNSPKSPCFTEQPVHHVSRENRRSFHGLVSDSNSDDYDELELMKLEPAPLPEALLKILGRAVLRPNERSILDV
ncbi:hypothetical protein LINPERPRIM_LOCUS9500 [Linum perenne]